MRPSHTDTGWGMSASYSAKTNHPPLNETNDYYSQPLLRRF